MKRIKFRGVKLRKVNIQEISERSLIINLYFTQALVLLLAILLLWLLSIPPEQLFNAQHGAGATIVTYGVLFAAIVLFSDFILARWIPKHVTDDGGVNEKIHQMFKANTLHYVSGML